MAFLYNLLFAELPHTERIMDDLYKSEIVDPGDRASRLASDICRASYENCGAITVVPHQLDNFRGPTGFLWNPEILAEMARNSPTDWAVWQTIQNDGAGGKPQFFTLLGEADIFRGLGWEIIAMVADDIARFGGKPVVMANEMNVKAITDENFHLFQACMEGYGKALAQARLVNITGEIAIMKHSITAFCDNGTPNQFILNWSATCTGLARKEFLIDGSEIKPGMPIVGFREHGYRCNGGTFFTNLITRWCPNGQYTNQIMDFVRALTIPSQSYARTICRLVGWNDDGTRGETLANITGTAHITGGGVWGKFGELLPDGVGAVLDSMPNPPSVLLDAQHMSQEFDELCLSDYQGYGTFHGGCGMLIVCHSMKDADAIINEANKDGIEAQIVGRTHALSENSNKLAINSRFKNHDELLVIEEST